MGRRAIDAGPRTSSVGWASLAEFCADCPMQRSCERETVAEVSACELVLSQEAIDEAMSRPRLRRSAMHEPPLRRIRRAFTEVDPEDVSPYAPVPREPGMPWKLSARIAWLEEHRDDA